MCEESDVGVYQSVTTLTGSAFFYIKVVVFMNIHAVVILDSVMQLYGRMRVSTNEFVCVQVCSGGRKIPPVIFARGEWRVTAGLPFPGGGFTAIEAHGMRSTMDDEHPLFDMLSLRQADACRDDRS